MTAYLLLHYYEYGPDNIFEEVKHLGIFSSREAAKKEIEFFYPLPGFRDHPKSCFYIQEYEVDKKSEWIEGFFTE